MKCRVCIFWWSLTVLLRNQWTSLKISKIYVLLWLQLATFQASGKMWYDSYITTRVVHLQSCYFWRVGTPKWSKTIRSKPPKNMETSPCSYMSLRACDYIDCMLCIFRYTHTQASCLQRNAFNTKGSLLTPCLTKTVNESPSNLSLTPRTALPMMRKITWQ